MANNSNHANVLRERERVGSEKRGETKTRLGFLLSQSFFSSEFFLFITRRHAYIPGRAKPSNKAPFFVSF